MHWKHIEKNAHSNTMPKGQNSEPSQMSHNQRLNRPVECSAPGPSQLLLHMVTGVDLTHELEQWRTQKVHAAWCCLHEVRKWEALSQAVRSQANTSLPQGMWGQWEGAVGVTGPRDVLFLHLGGGCRVLRCWEFTCCSFPMYVFFYMYILLWY